MADVDLIKLYSKRILALAADVPHADRLAAPDASAVKRSPLCGSQMTVDVALADDRLAGLGMDVKACALGQASASIFARAAVGATRARIQSGRDALVEILAGRSEDAAGWPDLEVLTPAREHKNRHASILLVWDAALDAMAAADTTAANDGAQTNAEVNEAPKTMVSSPLTSG